MGIKTNWYVITGGPSSGKTKTIDYLAFLGHNVIPEAARILIDNEMSKGKTLKEIRSDEAEFQRIALKMKIDLENRLPSEQLVFLERGIPDSITYYEVCGADPEPIREFSQNKIYKGIFLLEQVAFEQDYARTEDEETANKISESLRKEYSDLGYDVIIVPVMPIDERVQFILDRVER